MGLDFNSTQALIYAKRIGVDFGETAMIGRQALHLDKSDLGSIFQAFGLPCDDSMLDLIYTKHDGYAEHLFQYLGGRAIDSFDNSRYEGATHLADMNVEIPESFKDRYTAVVDWGSLEHIFNFPQAIRNCMEMVKVGGHYLSIAGANNFMGHGFYQFSPELFFSVFTRENGFTLVKVIAMEVLPHSQWYDVRSPAQVNGRVTLISNTPVYLLVIARKTMQTELFRSPPQQSDYVSLWSRGDASSLRAPATPVGAPATVTDPSCKHRTLFGVIKAWIPLPIRNRIKRTLLRTLLPCDSKWDSRFFRPFDPTEDGPSPPKPLNAVPRGGRDRC